MRQKAVPRWRCVRCMLPAIDGARALHAPFRHGHRVTLAASLGDRFLSFSGTGATVRGGTHGTEDEATKQCAENGH